MNGPELEVVGVKVCSETKHNVDIGTLVGLGPVTGAASASRDDTLALDADCVASSASTPRQMIGLRKITEAFTVENREQNDHCMGNMPGFTATETFQAAE